MTRLEKDNGITRLIVDGKEFLILGLQWACNSCFNRETMGPLFKQAKEMHANTAVLPVYWMEIEPEPDRFDFSLVDYRIKMCRQNGLKLVLLWFGSYKNAECCYAPDYIRNDHIRYQKAVRKNRSLQEVCLCPSGTAALERDKLAVSKMMAYIKEIDEKEDTVIMIQIENEPGLMGTDMCYCEKCQSLYSDNLTPEQFTASLIRDYVDAVAGAAKSVCALPMYTNVWLSEGPASMPGLNYPSGGAVPSMLEVWLGKIRNLDFIAPDIYQYSYRRFNEICADYSANGNTLFIAETSSGLHGRQEKNVFYALGCHGAIGFDPWSIDIPFPNQNESPMVDPVDQTWGPQAYILRDSYLAIRDSMPAITAARKSSNLVTFVQEEGEHGTSFVLNDVLFSIGYENNARGMIIGFGSGEFITLGAGFRITPKKPYPSGESIKFRSLFRGRFVDGIWCNINPVIRETTFSDSAALRTAGVMRFKL